MLELSRPSPVQTQRVAHERGGFVWWYLDIRTPRGDGLVLIWSLGLPFLPHSRDEAPACQRPAVSVAHYVDGKSRLYLLQDYAAEQAVLDLTTGSGHLGASAYCVSDNGIETNLQIVLDEPMPGTTERLQGDLRVLGPSVALPLSKDQDVTHIWTPRSMCAVSSGHITYEGRTHDILGSAYFDSNLSQTALHRQDISSWRWGRVTFPGSTIVYYHVEKKDGTPLRYMYEQAENGSFRRMVGRMAFAQTRRGAYGLQAPHQTYLAARGSSVLVRTTHVIEDGPFYQRALSTGIDERGRFGVGFSEVVAVDRVDRPWQRPLVRMRTHSVGRANSPFLPLFNGPRSGRAGRLFSSLLASGGSW